jgi:hypothetical protein
MTTTQRRTLYLLLSGLLLSVGTPLYIGLTRPDRAGYFLHPMIFGLQVFPYLLAAGLWLPWSSPRAGAVAQTLAGVLFLAAVLLYVPMITGLWSTGGDMVGLGFLLIAIVTTSCLLVVTLVAFGLLWLRHRTREAR